MSNFRTAFKGKEIDTAVEVVNSTKPKIILAGMLANSTATCGNVTKTADASGMVTFEISSYGTYIVTGTSLYNTSISESVEVAERKDYSFDFSANIILDYNVGDSVYIPIDGVNEEFIIVHQGNPNSSIYDESCNGTWLVKKYPVEGDASSGPWAPSSSVEYGSSTIHTYLNTTFYDSLGSVAAAIKSVKIPVKTAIGADGLSTKVFALSSLEVGLSSSSTSPQEGSSLDYFVDDDSRKLYPNQSTTAVDWWLRTTGFSGGKTKVYWVTTYGTLASESTAFSKDKNYRPAMIVYPDTRVNLYTNTIVV